jgi:Flp pilus assembly protein TadD
VSELEAELSAEKARHERLRQLAQTRALINAGRFAEAEAAYRGLLKRFPDDAETHLALGVLYDEILGRKSDAARQYRDYLRLRPEASDAARVRERISKLSP